MLKKNNVMESLSKHFQKISHDLKILREDTEKIIIQKTEEKDQEEKGGDKKKVKKPFLRSIQPTNIIYKDKKEAKEAKKNPEESFIINQINKIFGK